MPYRTALILEKMLPTDGSSFAPSDGEYPEINGMGFYRADVLQPNQPSVSKR